MAEKGSFINDKFVNILAEVGKNAVVGKFDELMGNFRQRLSSDAEFLRIACEMKPRYDELVQDDGIEPIRAFKMAARGIKTPRNRNQEKGGSN